MGHLIEDHYYWVRLEGSSTWEPAQYKTVYKRFMYVDEEGNFTKVPTSNFTHVPTLGFWTIMCEWEQYADEIGEEIVR